MNLGILLWNTCNAQCAHCAVSSGPKEKPVMTDEEIFRIVDSAFYDCSIPSIGLSGGEAFFFFERLRKIVRYATGKGALVAINTNCFWGKSAEKANEYVKAIKEDGVKKIVVSTDDFHTPYVTENSVINVINACIKHHLEVDIQFVSSKASSRLHNFLSRHSDSLLNISSREIPVHPVGRAAELISADDIHGKKRIPLGLCPSAIPSISASGKIIPCCNSAGHLEALQLGEIKKDHLPDVYDKFKNDSLFYTLWRHGPSSLYAAAQLAGMKEPISGYIDQCHLCYEIFKDKNVADAVRSVANKMAEKDMYDHLMAQFLKFRSESTVDMPNITVEPTACQQSCQASSHL